MNFSKLFISALFICSINSCNFSDDTEELSGGYFYRNEGINLKDILSHSPDHQNILSTVVKYKYNYDFIVAVQKPDYSAYKQAIVSDIRDSLETNSVKLTSNMINVSDIKADSILKHNKYYRAIFAHTSNYWLITNHPYKMFGPLTKTEYIQLKNKLLVPGSLDTLL